MYVINDTATLQTTISALIAPEKVSEQCVYSWTLLNTDKIFIPWLPNLASPLPFIPIFLGADEFIAIEASCIIQ